MSKTIPLDVVLQVDRDIFEQLADSILEDLNIDLDLFGLEWEHIRDRIRDQPEFQDQVVRELRRSISGWDPDWSDWIDWGIVSESVTNSTDPEWNWLHELEAETQRIRDDQEEQRRLRQEAEQLEQARQQDQINQHLIEQLRSQGYVIYHPDGRTKRKPASR